MSDNIEHYTKLFKTFPYFISWYDNGDENPCSGHDHVRTLEEAFETAYIRVLHSSFDSIASIYHGNFVGRSSLIRRYRWEDRKIIHEDLKR